jgi:hypothetical protein
MSHKVEQSYGGNRLSELRQQSIREVAGKWQQEGGGGGRAQGEAPTPE